MSIFYNKQCSSHINMLISSTIVELFYYNKCPEKVFFTHSLEFIT